MQPVVQQGYTAVLCTVQLASGAGKAGVRHRAAYQPPELPASALQVQKDLQAALKLHQCGKAGQASTLAVMPARSLFEWGSLCTIVTNWSLMQVCSACEGRLLLLGKFQADGTPAKQRAPSGFSLFVRDHFSAVKSAAKPGTPHKEIMQTLSNKWKNRSPSSIKPAA